MASTILGLFTSYPIGQMQNLLDFMCSMYDILAAISSGSTSYILMSLSLPLQYRRRMGLTRPCICPAKKARIDLLEAGLPPMAFRGLLGVLTYVSARETSFPRTKTPSETSALHTTLIVFFRRSSCRLVVYVAWTRRSHSCDTSSN